MICRVEVAGHHSSPSWAFIRIVLPFALPLLCSLSRSAAEAASAIHTDDATLLEAVHAINVRGASGKGMGPAKAARRAKAGTPFSL